MCTIFGYGLRVIHGPGPMKLVARRIISQLPYREKREKFARKKWRYWRVVTPFAGLVRSQSSLLDPPNRELHKNRGKSIKWERKRKEITWNRRENTMNKFVIEFIRFDVMWTGLNFLRREKRIRKYQMRIYVSFPFFLSVSVSFSLHQMKFRKTRAIYYHSKQNSSTYDALASHYVSFSFFFITTVSQLIGVQFLARNCRMRSKKESSKYHETKLNACGIQYFFSYYTNR